MKPLATSQAKRAAEDPHGFFLDLRREGRQEPRGCSQEADGQEEKGEGPHALSTDCVHTVLGTRLVVASVADLQSLWEHVEYQAPPLACLPRGTDIKGSQLTE